MITLLTVCSVFLFIAAAFEMRGCKALLNFPLNAHIYSADLDARKSATAGTPTTTSSSTKSPPSKAPSSPEQGRLSTSPAKAKGAKSPTEPTLTPNHPTVYQTSTASLPKVAAQVRPFALGTMGVITPEMQFQAAMMQRAAELYQCYSYLQLLATQSVPSPYSMVFPQVPPQRSFSFQEQVAFMNAATSLKRPRSQELFAEASWEAPASKRNCSSGALF